MNVLSSDYRKMLRPVRYPSLSRGFFVLGLVLASALWGVSGYAQPQKSADGFYEYQEPTEARERSSSSTAPKKLAGDYGRYKGDFAELCQLVEADGRRMLLYQTLMSMNVADRLCIDCRPFARAFVAPCRPAELRGGPKKRVLAASSLSEGEEDQAEATLVPTATPTPSPARLPSLSVNEKLLELGRKFAQDKKRNRETLRALDKLALLLSTDEGSTPGEKEYGETFSAFLLSPFVELREQFAAEDRAAQRQAAEDASVDAALGGAGGLGYSTPRGTEGLFDR